MFIFTSDGRRRLLLWGNPSSLSKLKPLDLEPCYKVSIASTTIGWTFTSDCRQEVIFYCHNFSSQSEADEISITMYPSCKCCERNTQSLVLVPCSHSVWEPAGASALGEPGGEISITESSYWILHIFSVKSQTPNMKRSTSESSSSSGFMLHLSSCCCLLCMCSREDSRFQNPAISTVNFRLIVHKMQYWNMNWPIAFGKLNSSAECDWSIWNSMLCF